MSVAELKRRSQPNDPTQVEKHLKILKKFVEVYCRKNHRNDLAHPCDECQKLIDYARQRLIHCPYDPKPKCKECPTHCYRPQYREKVKEIMRFSGMHFVKRGRLDWLIKYFLLKGA